MTKQELDSVITNAFRSPNGMSLVVNTVDSCKKYLQALEETSSGNHNDRTEILRLRSRIDGMEFILILGGVQHSVGENEFGAWLLDYVFPEMEVSGFLDSMAAYDEYQDLSLNDLSKIPEQLFLLAADIAKDRWKNPDVKRAAINIAAEFNGQIEVTEYVTRFNHFLNTGEVIIAPLKDKKDGKK